MSSVSFSFFSAHRPVLVFQSLIVFLVKDIVLLFISVNPQDFIFQQRGKLSKVFDNLSFICVSFSPAFTFFKYHFWYWKLIFAFFWFSTAPFLFLRQQFFVINIFFLPFVCYRYNVFVCCRQTDHRSVILWPYSLWFFWKRILSFRSFIPVFYFIR